MDRYVYQKRTIYRKREISRKVLQIILINREVDKKLEEAQNDGSQISLATGVNQDLFMGQSIIQRNDGQSLKRTLTGESNGDVSRRSSVSQMSMMSEIQEEGQKKVKTKWEKEAKKIVKNVKRYKKKIKQLPKDTNSLSNFINVNFLYNFFKGKRKFY